MAYIEDTNLVEEIKSLKISVGGKDAFSDEAKESVLRIIREQPTADVVEVRHGEWIECFEDWRKQIAVDECSVCGFRHYGTSISDYNYCPNCGADMRGAKDE